MFVIFIWIAFFRSIFIELIQDVFRWQEGPKVNGIAPVVVVFTDKKDKDQVIYLLLISRYQSSFFLVKFLKTKYMQAASNFYSEISQNLSVSPKPWRFAGVAQDQGEYHHRPQGGAGGHPGFQ